MVSGPSLTPPGYSGKPADAIWCARHKRWVTQMPNGQYRCPKGHTLEPDEATKSDES
jgi:hypothetical protein